MNAATRELVALAAAIAGKCRPCFAHHYQQELTLGIDPASIKEAIQLAKDIRASGDKHMDGYADRRMIAKQDHPDHA
jgi:AhpD family alkylhydroperoxidase